MKWMSSLRRTSLIVIALHISLFFFVKPLPKPLVISSAPIKVRSIKLIQKKKAALNPVWGKIGKLPKISKTVLDAPPESIQLTSSFDEDPTQSIFVTLQERIELPKNGFVKLTFSTDSRGCICNMTINECAENENADYVQHLLKGMPLKYKNIGPLTVTLKGIEE